MPGPSRIRAAPRFKSARPRASFPAPRRPTAKESDGTKNLASIPGPDGKGFKAFGVSHLVYNVADVDQSRDFYMNLLGMKIVYYKPGDVFGVDAQGGPICFMKFGRELFLPPQEPAS